MRDAASLGLTMGILGASNVLGHRLAPPAAAATVGGQVTALAVLARAAGLSAGELGLDHRTWRSGLRWGAGSLVAVTAGYGILLAVPVTRGAIAGSGSSWPRAVVRAAVTIPLVTVVPEEFAFRGVLLGLLARRHGRRWGVLVSSAVFGLWHVLPALTTGAANETVIGVVGGGRRGAVIRVLGTVLVTTVGGLLMGGVRLRGGSLLAPILLHWAVNGIGELIARAR